VLFKGVDLVVGEVYVLGRDCFGQMMRLGCSHDRGGDDRVVKHPGQRNLGHADAAGFRDLLDGVHDGLVEG
jgi:hypothetical protein